MKAVQFAGYGDPEVLDVVEVEEPHAGPGQVRIAVKAVGVNAVDWKIRKGMLAQYFPQEFPVTVGTDASGVVDEVGDGVDGVAVGDAVFGVASSGATAEFAVLDEWFLKPERMSFEEASGLPLPTEAAWRGVSFLGLEPGQTILINGAAGGVGLSAVQFALNQGLVVIGTASEGHHEHLRSLGVVPTTYGEGLVDRVRELAPDGVDGAFDVNGFGALPDLIAITGGADRVVTISDFTAAQYGVQLSPGPGEDRAPQARAEAARLFEDGKFRMPVEETFPLEEVGAAHAKSEAGHVLGRFVVVVG